MSSKRGRAFSGLATLLLIMSACTSGHSSLRGRDRAAPAGIAQTTRSWMAAVGDVDGDGRTDFVLVRHRTQFDTIYRNLGGRFAEFAPRTLVQRDRHACSLGDVNHDGLTDIYCSIGGHHGTGMKANELWLQQRNRTFVDRAKEYGVTDDLGRGRWNALVDVNGDGYVDLYLGNETPRADGTPVPNHLFLNLSGRRLDPDPAAGLDEAVGSFCLQVVDFDADGDRDILSCGKTGTHLYRNDGRGHFEDIASTTNLLPVPAGVDQTAKTVAGSNEYWESARLADFDGDGFMDAVGVAETTVVMQRGGKNGFATAKEIRSVNNGLDVGLGDINADGKPDIYVVQGCVKDANEPDLMLLNDGSGASFEDVDMDQATSGCGDNVAPIDYNGDGRTDFIVLNGHELTRGPLQLIDFAPAP